MEKNFTIPYLTFNEKCPVCLEKKGEFFVLNCLHKIHLECSQSLHSLECPLCRKEMEDLPECIKENILGNIKKQEDERIEEERRELANTYLHTHQQFLILRPTPQMEAIAALDFLRENGIPLFYLPATIEITLFRNVPLPQPGVIFHTIFKMILEWIEGDCGEGETFSEDIEELLEDNSEVEEESEMENIFGLEEDDQERSVRVRRI